MKKLFSTLLLGATCCLGFAFASCDQGDVTPTQTCSVTFEQVDGIGFDTNLSAEGTIKKGATLTFTLDLVAWQGSDNFSLLAGGEAIAPDANGVYSVVVEENLSITFAPVTLTFAETEGVSFLSEYESGATLPFNSIVTFTVDVDPFYTQPTVVRAGARVVTPDDSGTYAFNITSSVSVSVGGVEKAYPSISGEGKADNPFFIYTATDWAYIAEQVNSGNVNYINAYYQLEADIDFKGRTIPVIGDGSQIGDTGVQTYFGGYFNGMGHTLSNFVIQENGAPFVGVFGYVVADLSNEHFGTILNLNLENCSINAVMDRADAQLLACGALIGYGIGANVYTSSITGATVELTGNDGREAYVGGVIGIQQSAYMDMGTYKSRAPSSIAYVSVTDSTINGLSGIIPAAGGVVGYTYAPEALSTASIINCYANGTLVSGGIRTGGVVGQLSSYASVYDCYADGSVNASTPISNLNLWPEAYATAHAGGIVGYAENDSLIVNSFSTAYLSASAALGGKYENMDGVAAFCDPDFTATVESKQCVIKNCYYAEGGVSNEYDLTDPSFIKNTLKWPAYNWVISANEYPTFNMEENEAVNFILTVRLLGDTVNTQTALTATVENSYAPLSFLLLHEEVALTQFMYGDKGGISYDYYFDAECTQRVPYCFILDADVTLYTRFEDYTKVSGKYELLVSKGNTASLTLYPDGVFEYEDGTLISGGYYHYNGTDVYFEGARFARYFSEGEIGDIYQMDFYLFRGVVDGGDLLLFDGTYFTETAPLRALSSFGFAGEYYVGDTHYFFYKDFTGEQKTANGTTNFTYALNGETITLSTGETGVYSGGTLSLNGVAELQEIDRFKGDWYVSTAIPLQLSFDGKGNWEMIQFAYDRSGNTAVKETVLSTVGTYVVSGNVATLLQDGADIGVTVSIESDGTLYFSIGANGMSFGREHSNSGEWIAKIGDKTVRLTLFGINEKGLGTGSIDFIDGNTYALYYGYENGRIYLYNESVLFGYCNYQATTDTIVAYLYDPYNYVIDEANAYVFYHYDAFTGDWVGVDDVLNELTFNGEGCYQLGTLIGIQGELVLNGERVEYTLDATTLKGHFYYLGVKYEIEYSPFDNLLLIFCNGNYTPLERKDGYASQAIVDLDGNRYVFNGKGNLTSGGVLTVLNKDGGKSEYNYKINGEVTELRQGGVSVGTLTVENDTYVFTVNGVSINLYLESPFAGVWGVNGEFAMLTIQPMNLAGISLGDYNGKSLTFEHHEEGYLSFRWTDGVSIRYLLRKTAQNENGTTYFTGELAMASIPSLDAVHLVCAPVDELFGDTWTKSGFFNNILTFDGLSKAPSTQGYAIRKQGNQQSGYSSSTWVYQYDAANDCLYFWSEDSGNMHLIVWCEPTETGAYVNADGTKAFKLIQIDSLHMIEAYEEATKLTYVFDGQGTVTDTNGKTYRYEILDHNAVNGEILLRLTDSEDNEYTATLTYGMGETLIVITA